LSGDDYQKLNAFAAGYRLATLVDVALQAVEPFRQTDRLSDSERAMLMGGACAKAYGWSPKKA